MFKFPWNSKSEPDKWEIDRIKMRLDSIEDNLIQIINKFDDISCKVNFAEHRLHNLEQPISMGRGVTIKAENAIRALVDATGISFGNHRVKTNE